ncbi:MAG: hypothetical protein V2A73_07765 [Pseudomonadota bacterium]
MRSTVRRSPGSMQTLANTLARPARHLLVGCDHQHASVAVAAGTQGGGIERPDPLLVIVASQLDFDDDAENRLFVEEQDRDIGSVFRWA